MAMLYSRTPESAIVVPAMLAPLAAVWKNTMDAAMTTCTVYVLLLQVNIDLSFILQFAELQNACRHSL